MREILGVRFITGPLRKVFDVLTTSVAVVAPDQDLPCRFNKGAWEVLWPDPKPAESCLRYYKSGRRHYIAGYGVRLHQLDKVSEAMLVFEGFCDDDFVPMVPDCPAEDEWKPKEAEGPPVKSGELNCIVQEMLGRMKDAREGPDIPLREEDIVDWENHPNRRSQRSREPVHH